MTQIHRELTEAEIEGDEHTDPVWRGPDCWRGSCYHPHRGELDPSTMTAEEREYLEESFEADTHPALFPNRL